MRLATLKTLSLDVKCGTRLLDVNGNTGNMLKMARRLFPKVPAVTRQHEAPARALSASSSATKSAQSMLPTAY